MGITSKNNNSDNQVAMKVSTNSIIVNILFTIGMGIGISVIEKINLVALMTDAWHNRSDFLYCIGSFIGVFGSRMGIKVLDQLASVVI